MASSGLLRRVVLARSDVVPRGPVLNPSVNTSLESGAFRKWEFVEFNADGGWAK
jgi:hypothetical protein